MVQKGQAHAFLNRKKLIPIAQGTAHLPHEQRPRPHQPGHCAGFFFCWRWCPTAHDELRTALTRATRATRTPSSTRPVVPREVAAFLMRKNSGRMWSKSLILLRFVSSGAVKTQNLPNASPV